MTIASGNIPQEMINDVIRKQVANQESFWRRYAKESATKALIKERSVSGAALAEEILSFVHEGNWPSLDDCIPEGSILDAIDKYFLEFTDIPRELPFYSVLHYLSTLMLQQGVHIMRPDKQVIFPDLWTVLLAASGAGKSMTQKAISQALGGPIQMFPDFSSTLKLMQNLETHNRSLYLRDEFAQLIKAIRTDSKMDGVRDIFLQAYNNDQLTYRTKTTNITIDQPALSVLGFTPIATITTAISADMLDDGFAQRFAFCFAEKEPGRRRIADYDFGGLGPGVKPLWDKITSTPFHERYHLDEVGRAVYQKAFELLVERSEEIGLREDYARRVLWRSYKYGLLYHVLAGKTDPYLHADDIAFGARLAAFNLRDSARLLGMFDRLTPPTTPTGSNGVISAADDERSRDLKRAREVIERLGKQGKIVDARALASYIKKGSDNAKGLLLELSEDPALAAFIKVPAQL